MNVVKERATDLRYWRNLPRALIAALLLLLFVGMNLGGVRHAHGRAHGFAAGTSELAAAAALSTPEHGCDLCDFASRLVPPPAAAPAPVPVPTLGAVRPAAPSYCPPRAPSGRRARPASRAPPLPGFSFLVFG